MNSRGVFFTLDALLALAAAFLFMVVFFYWSSFLNVQTFDQIDLVFYSQSVASVMEQQGAFAQENISSFLGNYTRNETCFNVTVYAGVSLLPQYSGVKNGCTNTSYPSYASRSFVLPNGSFYLAKIQGWYV